LTVHGRTRACKFSGHAEYDTIRSIKQTVSIPVIANGDIDSPQKARAVLEYTGADGIMIGRAARGRPWIFSQINAHLSNEIPPDVPLTSVRDIILAHLESLYAYYGVLTGVRVGRKHLTWYAQYQERACHFREQVIRVETPREQLRLARAFFDGISHEFATESRRSRGERSGQNNQQEKNHQQEEEALNSRPHGSPRQASQHANRRSASQLS